MATTTTDFSIVNFVKEYPITLCGFSLIFMPSVHRLLLYFSPLLLSTAIFIMAMFTWGPSAVSSDQSDKRRGKHNEWAFKGSFKIYGEEEKEEEVAEVSQARKEESSIEGKASKTLKAQIQEPDPNFDEESKPVGTNGAISTGGLHGDHIGSAAAPDLQGHCVGTASSVAEPDPDLHGEQHAEAAHNHDFSAAKHQLHAAADHHCLHHPHDHEDPAPINPNDQAAGAHLGSRGAEPDHLDYHDAADQVIHGNDYGDSEVDQGDDYHDAARS